MIIKSLKGRILKEFGSSTFINNNLLISFVSLSLFQVSLMRLNWIKFILFLRVGLEYQLVILRNEHKSMKWRMKWKYKSSNKTSKILK